MPQRGIASLFLRFSLIEPGPVLLSMRVPESEESGDLAPDPSSDPSETPLPDALPPVEPPSARFIVQLFLIPALIVGGVIGIYFLFGRLATGELDWRQQVENVRAQNPHVRWRGALSLAQMLDADARMGSDGQQLAANAEVAEALTELFSQTREISPRDEQTASQVEFLAKALGRLDKPEIVFPVLLGAISDDGDALVRKHSLNALAMIAGRALEQERPFSDASLVEPIVDISQSSDPLDRHQAAFILGMMSSTVAEHRLEVLLQDGDLMTRANAAIGLARQNSQAGLPIFEDVFADAVARPIDPAQVKNEEQGEDYFERTLLLRNSLRAVELLGPELDDEQRTRLVNLLEQVSDATLDNELRTRSRELSLVLAEE